MAYLEDCNLFLQLVYYNINTLTWDIFVSMLVNMLTLGFYSGIYYYGVTHVEIILCFDLRWLTKETYVYS